jgi:hypothetical protein
VSGRGLRLVKGRLGHREARAEREVRVSGRVQVPSEGGSKYLINCNLSKHARYPMAYHIRVSPLCRNPYGTWPEVPEGHKAGDLYVGIRNGKSVQWKRLYWPLGLRNEDEVLVFLVKSSS